MLSTFSKLQEEYQGFETNYMKILTYSFPKEYKEEYRSYEYHRLCTIIDGRKNVTINNGNNFTYDKSEFILLPPHSTVNMHITADTKAVAYELSDQLIDDVQDKIETEMNDSFEDRPNLYKNNCSDNITQSLSKIQYILNHDDSSKEFLVDLYAQELTYKMLKEQFILTSKSIKRCTNPVDIAIEIMKQDGNEHIGIYEIADKLHMTGSNLAYQFKKTMNMTPKQYQNLIKLKKAKNLLQSKNVTEVASQLGFDNISYFIRLFKGYYGVTPKQYVKATLYKGL